MITPSIKVAVLLTLSGLGWTTAVALPVEGPGDIPWKELAGGSAAVLMLAALVIFLKFLREERSARDVMLAEERKARAEERNQDRAHLERVVSQCTTTTQNVAERFNETTTRLMDGMREDLRAARAAK